MSRHSTQNNLFLTIVCPYRKWTDLYISNTIGQSSIQSKVIAKESDIHELACEKVTGSLFGDSPLYHIIVPTFTLLKTATQVLKPPCIFSTSAINSRQKKTLVEAKVEVMDMQYPKSSDVNTALHLFKKLHSSQANFNNLISRHSSNLDDLLEACERQHLLSLDADTTIETNTQEQLIGFKLIEWVYHRKMDKINHFISHLPQDELISAYWLINKQIHIFVRHENLEGAVLTKITPWRSMHSAITDWHRTHRRKISAYAQLCHQIEKSIKGAPGPHFTAMIKELFIRMGQVK